MSKQSTPKRGVTPPKGQPTRPRNAATGRRRIFGPVVQWILVTMLLIVIFVLLVVMTDGGDFNPFNDDAVGGLVIGRGVQPPSGFNVATSIGVDPHLM